MKGMAAIVMVIILGAVLMMVGSMLSLTSINEGQLSLESQKSEVSQGMVDACVEEGLIWINEFDTMPANIISNFGTCPVVVNSHVGTSWDFTVGSTINVKLNRGTSLSISAWQEL